MQEESAPPVARCPRCQVLYQPDQLYCVRCGYRLIRQTSVPFLQRTWWKVLVVGISLYYVDVKSLVLFRNLNFVPTVILLGAFVVPATFVIYLYERGELYDVPFTTVALTFFSGGVLGTIGAQYLEEGLVGGVMVLAVVAVAFSEEVAKLFGVVWLLWRREYATQLHGIVLGAAAGMGFAAFESMGYGFTYLLNSHGDLNVLGEVLLNRGLLSPLAHGTWTAIVAGVLWRERAQGHGVFNRHVLAAFAVAVLLHTLWDLTAGSPIDIQLPGMDLKWRVVDLALPALSLPVPALVIGGIGLWLLRRLFRDSQIAAHSATG